VHRCSYDGEVQSTHWSPASVTIFVVIVYRYEAESAMSFPGRVSLCFCEFAKSKNMAMLLALEIGGLLSHYFAGRAILVPASYNIGLHVRATHHPRMGAVGWHRHATLPEDGRPSTVEEPNIVKDFLFAVSDDKTHDAQVRTECSRCFHECSPVAPNQPTCEIGYVPHTCQCRASRGSRACAAHHGS
jgi:hypothetical protein